MKKTIHFAAIIAALILPVMSFAGQSEDVYQSENDFASTVDFSIQLYLPTDAFAGLAECSVIDARTIRAYSLVEAAQIIKPCLAGVSRRYNAQTEIAAASLAGIEIKTGAAGFGTPIYKDLAHALSLRGGKILGHPARVLNKSQSDAASRSVVQDALDRCILPMVIRPVQSSEDFIRIYGGCITRDPALKIKEIRPARGHRLSVTILTDVEAAAIDSFNGLISVTGDQGPVSIMVMAYAQNFNLPY